ncbi:uncharacterized protein NPF isoform X1 [Macrobrachium rosenbergii]|uniref:Preproneuropeptide F II n=1 Tax=Macrobrachium rosenbergii TaxID=79674 RepID=A0A1L5YJM1_MACRS|nr:preproneuropeptide F II [Macrobrachium rosenbergii]QJQ81518.1 neuropeptide F 2 [Macrobrachium nipponense]
MYQRVGQVWAAILVGVVVVSVMQMGGVEGKPDPTQLAAMADALKYLQELDKYYSQVSRPSPRSAPGPASQIQALEKTLKFLQLQELGKLYSLRARPRFGKRSEYAVPPGDVLMEASERLMETLARRR